MTATLDQVLAYKVGDSTIGENIRRAIESGVLRRCEDGRLELVQGKDGEPVELTYYMMGPGQFSDTPCSFLNGFMFRHVYKEAFVPLGCSACYKVKIVSRTLRQLMAVKAIAETFSVATKSGPEYGNPDNPHPYGTYFYLRSLDEARALYREIRPLLDADPLLGSDMEMLIKRGCTNYEVKCGPSDRYRFDPELAEVEAVLQDHFVPVVQPYPRQILNSMRMMEAINLAYRSGDETYKDFTAGKSLAPPVLRYAVDADDAQATDADNAEA